LRAINFEQGAGMTANVGGIDRIVRIVVGAGLIVATLMGVIGVWGWIGVVVLATGVFRFCPAYLPFGFRSCKTP
jgi:hypothetical protein